MVKIDVSPILVASVNNALNLPACLCAGCDFLVRIQVVIFDSLDGYNKAHADIFVIDCPSLILDL